MKYVGVDTEYDNRTVPFIVTMCDENMETALLYPQKPKDHFLIKSICESHHYTKVFHSATSDMFALHNVGIQVVPPYHCTFILASILDENYKSKKLKDLAKRFLKEPCVEAAKLKRVIRKMKKLMGAEFSWDKIPKFRIEPYAVKDPFYTLRLFLERYQKHIPEIQDLYDLEISLVPMILEMMKRGMPINREFCTEEISRLRSMYIHYYNKLIKLNKKVFNIQSPKDVNSFMKRQDIYIMERTKFQAMKTDKETLKYYSKNFPSLKYILNCRGASKQIDTYYLPLLNEYTTPDDDVAHFHLYQGGTKTGRFSAELVQTIPKRDSDTDIPNNVRRAFKVRKDHVNVYFDYDQIEMRLYVHFSNNESLIEAIKEGFDPHDKTAKDIFPEVFKQNPVKARRDAKDVNFGIIYGMGITALAHRLQRSKQEATIIMREYDRQYQIRKFISEQTSKLYRQGYVSLDWMSRKYYVPKNMAYKVVNLYCQGSAAYIIKYAMKNIAICVLDSIPGIKLLLQLHDELIFEFHKDVFYGKHIEYIRSLMEDHNTFKVPITVSVEYSDKNWKDKKKWN